MMYIKINFRFFFTSVSAVRIPFNKQELVTIFLCMGQGFMLELCFVTSLNSRYKDISYHILCVYVIEIHFVMYKL